MLSTLALALALSASLPSLAVPAFAVPDTQRVSVAAPAPDLTAAQRLQPSLHFVPRTDPLPVVVEARDVDASQEPSPLTFDVVETTSPEQSGPEIVEYSDAYLTRLKYHKLASYLTVPLFVGQYLVGQSLYDGEASSATRSAHGVLAASIGGLFAVNAVTGALNFWEGRKDPVDRTRRTIHSALMLLGGAGFVAVGALAKETEHSAPGTKPDNSLHRNVAIASMSVSLLSYAIMLPPFRE